MNTSFLINDSSATHAGIVRTHNEDSLVSLPQAGVWLVADGMGGHHDGRYASNAIAEAVSGVPVYADLDQAWDAVARAITAANLQIFARSQEIGKQMGSTVVALVLRGDEFVVLWAGDSRAYLFRHGQLIQLSRDHTQVEMMLERGLLTAAEAADHPMKHVLARAVGVQESLELEAVRDVVITRDLFVLCSDGLHGVLNDAEISALLAQFGENAGEHLISECLNRGAPDNVTVTLVAATEPTRLILNGTFV